MGVAFYADEQNKNWNNQAILKLVRSYFPDAYLQFATIGYQYHESINQFVPDTLEFLIPVSVYKKLGEKKIIENGKNLCSAVGGGCPVVKVGEEEEYAYLAFREKKVRKVKITFYVFC